MTPKTDNSDETLLRRIVTANEDGDHAGALDAVQARLAAGGFAGQAVEARFLMAAGFAAWFHVGVEAAGAWYGQAARLAGDVVAEDPALAVKILYEAGLPPFYLHDHATALAHWKRAVEIDRAHCGGANTPEIRRRMSLVAMDDGLYETALEWLMEARRPDADIQPRLVWTNARMLLAERMHDFATALELAEEVFHVFEDHGDRVRTEALALLNAARIEAAARPEALVRARLQRLAKLDVTAMPEDFVYQLALLQATLEAEFGETDRALALLEEARATHRRKRGGLEAAPLVAAELEILRDAGDTARAFALGRQVLEVGDDGTYDATVVTAGHLDLVLPWLALAETTDRLPRTSEALARRLSRLMIDGLAGEAEWMAADTVARLLRRRDPGAAIFFAKLAVERLSTAVAQMPAFARKGRHYLRARLQPYEICRGVLAEAGRVAEARRVAALARLERSATVTLRRRSEAAAPPVPWTAREEALRARWDGAASAIRAAQAALLRERAGLADEGQAPERQARLDAALSAAGEEADGLVGELFAGRRAAPDPGPVVEPVVELAAEPGVAVLRFEMAEAGLTVEVQSADSVFATGLDLSPGDAARLAGNMLAGLEAGTTAWRAPARRLHERLIGPVASRLAGIRRIEIVADPPLAFVPFAALADETGVLSDRFEIAWRSGSAGAPADGRRFVTVAALGSATGTASGLEALPAVAPELDAVAQAFNQSAGRPPALTRERLSAAFRARPDILHIAGHFDLVPDNPARSCLAMSDGTQLSCAAFADLLRESGRPAPRLVFLSACETGLPATDGMSPVDLPRWLLATGAEAVVATSWRIGDDAAAALAGRFYAALAETHDPVAALSRATRAEDPSHPGGWAFAHKVFVAGA